MRALVLLLLVVPFAAYADPAAPAPNDAKEHFRQGELYHRAGAYDEAIVEYEKAYALVPLPKLLFNIAQANRLRGNKAQALEYYRRFLAQESEGATADSARTQLAKLEKEMREEISPSRSSTPQPTGPEVAPTPLPPQLAPPPGVDRHEGRSMRVTALVVGGAGLVLLGMGTYYGLKASGTSDDLRRDYVNQSRPWDARARGLYEDGQNQDTLAKVFLITGGAVVLGGGVLYYLGWRAQRQASVSIAPMPMGAMVAWGQAF